MHFKVLLITAMNKEIEDIRMIREMMEKSSKFLSFNGLSIVFVGLIAIIGAAFIHSQLDLTNDLIQNIIFLLINAVVILFLSVCVITFFCWRKAKVNNQTLFNRTTRRAAYNLIFPLVIGGVLSIVFLLRGDISTAFSMTLIFYGLGLFNASKYTFSELHYLGIIEIIIGLFAVIFAKYALLFWAIGFGLFHILFGLIMYFKYETKKSR